MNRPELFLAIYQTFVPALVLTVLASLDPTRPKSYRMTRRQVRAVLLLYVVLAIGQGPSMDIAKIGAEYAESA